MPEPAQRRSILVIWCDVDGVEQRDHRIVHFEPSRGHYVKWNRHNIRVDPTEAELHIAGIGPRARPKRP